jgi:hypothetical protein
MSYSGGEPPPAARRPADAGDGGEDDGVAPARVLTHYADQRRPAAVSTRPNCNSGKCAPAPNVTPSSSSRNRRSRTCRARTGSTSPIDCPGRLVQLHGADDGVAEQDGPLTL